MELSHTEFSSKNNHVSHPLSAPGTEFMVETSPALRRTHNVWHGRKARIRATEQLRVGLSLTLNCRETQVNHPSLCSFLLVSVNCSAIIQIQ